MKKLVVSLLILSLAFALCACSGGDSKDFGTKGNSVSDILEQGVSADSPTEGGSASSAQSSAGSLSTDVDVDLTALSATMVYSEVQNMMLMPADYMGKSVRMSGDFAVAEGSDRMYYACIIRDATACCANGIEFLWNGEHSYPEDYPEAGTEITVVGDFDTYYEGEQMYIQLINAEVAF